MAHIDIYAYTNYRDYLRDCYGSSKFSYRSFARSAGYTSSSFYPNVVSGLRNLTAHYLPGFAKALKLNAREAEYLSLMVEFTHAVTESGRQEIFARMTTYMPDQVQRIHQKQREFYSHWLHVALHQALSAFDIREDISPIAQALRPRVGVREVQRSFKVLQELGMVRRDEDGFWRPSHTNMVGGREVGELYVRQYQSNLLDLGKIAHESFRPEDRMQITETLGVGKATAMRIRQRLREVHHEIVQMVLQDTEKEQTVIQWNLQLFPLVEET
jgi:uncharacterized protein (TIGR02147 family)